MTKVIGIDCPFAGEIVEIPFLEGNSDLVRGDEVIFKDADGKEEYGTLKYLNCDGFLTEGFLKDSKILRKATVNDTQKVAAHNEQSKEFLRICKTLVDKHKLDMQPFQVAHSFDGTKVCFMFTADDRVDFRELVKDLARVLKKQIHLKQVGPRDRAKMIGGYGRCGKIRCCQAFLRNMESINMEMVRVQGLEGRGSSKLSGACGKLLCSLRYEVETYRHLKKALPEISSKVKFKKSVNEGAQGIIIGLDVINQKIKVGLIDGKYVIAQPKDLEKIMLGDKWQDFKPGDIEKKTDFKSKISPKEVEEFMENQLSKI